MKYFLHDTSAFADEKITQLYMEFGFEGLGLFYTILERLAMQEKPMQEEVIKQQLYIGKRLEKQLKFMYKIGILSSKDGEVFSETLLNFSEKYQIKKEKTRIKVAEWRAKQGDVTSYTTVTEGLRNQPVTTVKISKVKESKVKKYIKKKLQPPLCVDVNDFIKEKELNIDGEYYLNSRTESKWIKVNNRPVLNWKLDIQNAAKSGKWPTKPVRLT